MPENAPLAVREKKSLAQFKSECNNAPIDTVEYISNGVTKHFLRCGTKTLYATEDTQTYMYDESLDYEVRLNSLQYAEIKKPELPDVKDAKFPEDAMITIDGKSVSNSNWVPCIMRLGGKVTRSF